MTVALAPHDLPTRRFVEQVMGLPVTLALRGRHAHSVRASEVWHDIVAELVEVDQQYSTYRPESPISRIGRGQLLVEDGPDDLPEVLALAEQARVATGGAFDVWRTGDDGGRVFDPSGVVKGWALERAAERLLELDDTGWCLSGGGDLVCSAGPAHFPAWRVGIEDPGDPQRLVAVVEVRDGGLATSGAAHRGDHIRDARTGLAPTGVASVTVLADTLSAADVEATCGFLMGERAAGWLATRPVRGAVVVPAGGGLLSVGTVPVAAP